MNLDSDIHILNGYFHNVMSLLKYIKKDAVIANEETKEMIEFAILKEKLIEETLEKLNAKDIQ
jgi:hypothetical protein